jgi:hypothetical protein
MLVSVGENHRVLGDSVCWTVQERKVSGKGSERWNAVTYHVSLETALSSLADYRVRAIPDSATGDEVVRFLAEIRRDIHEALTPFKMAV